jgi:hypothetical protein
MVAPLPIGASGPPPSLHNRRHLEPRPVVVPLMTRRRPTETAPPSTPADDLKRLVRAARGVDPETLNTLAAIAEAFKLEKKKAEIDADLSARKRLLSERRPQSLWDPHPAATIPSTRHSPADVSSAPACPAQEPPPSNDPSEPGLLENSGQRSPGHAPPVNPETSEVVRKTDHVEPPTDTVDGPQMARIRWALEGTRDWHKLGPRALTQKINERLDSEDGRKAGKHFGRPVSADTVRRFLKSAGKAP